VKELQRKRLAWILATVFVVALLMGPGPGMLLVNRPGEILGVPQLYAWGLIWYAVEVVVVLLAYMLIWSPRTRRQEQADRAAAAASAEDRS
jgi:membrane protein implicated in regulation of membrane protease activity